MLMDKADRDALMKITSDLHNNPTLVNDLLPRLNQVLTQSDTKMVEYRANTVGWEWAANDLLMFYQMRAKDLNPMVEALKAVKMHEMADKISNISLASAAVAASSYKDGEKEFKRVLSSIQSHVRDKYISSYAKLRPLPQVNRVFDIQKIWVNLQFENRTELKDPEDYRACMLSAFEENRLLLVKGHQGSGKTTAVRRIAFDWANGDLDKFDLVLVARYRDLVKQERNRSSIFEIAFDWIKWLFESLISNRYRNDENYTEDVIDLAIQWMKDKEYLTTEQAAFLQLHKYDLSTSIYADRLLVLIDGLDEATFKCNTLDKALRSQDAHGFNYHVVVMSRPQTIDEKVQCPSPIAFILPWTEEALVEYIRMHFLQHIQEGGLPDFAAHERAQKNTYAVLDFLTSHPHTEHIASIPLHITFICLLQEDGALEPGMSSSLLHRKLCYALVQRQVTLFNAPLYPELLKAFQGEFGTATQCPAVRNLALLAFEALVKGVGVKQVFSASDLKEKLIDKEILLKVGFLQTDDEGKGAKYEFLHISLQYYLAADLILEELRFLMPQLEIDKNDNRRLANEEILDEHPVLKELLHCTKIVSLEQMVCYLMEMILAEGSENRKISNSFIPFLVAWSWRHGLCIGEDIYTLELILRLGKQCDGDLKKWVGLVPAAIKMHSHSARSVLSMAGSVSVVRVHECGILFEDIDTVVFSSQPIHTSAQITENVYPRTGICLCLLEEGTIGIFEQTCRRRGWKKIEILRADIGHIAEIQTYISALSIDSVIIIIVQLDFKRPIHAINVTPLLQQFLSFVTVERLKLTNASISDLSYVLSDQRLKDTITRITLDRISFPNDDDLSKLGGILSTFKCLTQFCMLDGVLGGSQLTDLLYKLKPSTTCNELQLTAMSCLLENRTFTQFCSLLSDWLNMQRLTLANNNFSLKQIDQLIQATKSLKLIHLYLGGIPNLGQEHVDAFKSSHPGLEVVTD